MSHKCVRCGTVYEDDDASILRGCPKCGSIFFLYIKTAEDIERITKLQEELKQKETTLEKELAKKIEERKAEVKVEEKVEVEKPRVERPKVEEIKFGIETIRVPREGIYEINIDALMKKRPVIILERGHVYFIRLPSVFEK